jgi:hypothetical protein
MPYNVELDARITTVIADWGTTRKKMFGGTCYLLNGNMLCGVYQEYLILRLGDQWGAEALKQVNVKPFDITGHPMKGWVMVTENGYKGQRLLHWITKARKFVETLPAK